MNLRNCIVVLFSLSTIFSFAQNENNYWYFGNGASISFSNGIPKSINSSKLYTDEGSASVSDKNGKLLFYTDGVSVWNKNNKLMQGGTDLFGHKSSTQSATIVPHPSKVNLYYLFTTNEKGSNKGLRYSIIDVEKNNSLGQVIEKNVLVITPVSEKITIAKHANAKYFWIVTHKWNSDEFCSFLLTEKGLAKAPVISKSGTIHKDVGSGNNGESIGQMKISSNQKKLAAAITYKPNQPIEIFDFDNKTGKISNPRNIPTSGYAYGLEFSPDNTKLYASFLKGNAGVMQYNLEEDDIFENGTFVLSKPRGYENYGSIQLGPDGKIYVAKTGRYLDVISLPNNEGAGCSYKLGGVNLKDQSCVYGLPPKVYSRSIQAITEEKKYENNNESEETKTTGKKKITYGKTILCTENVVLDAGKANMVYLWSTGEKSRKITVTKPGMYNVVISHPSNISSENQSFNVTSGNPTVDLGEDKKLNCVASLELDAKNKGYSYKWSTGSKKQIISVDKSDTYSVTVTNGVCTATDKVKVEFTNKPPMFKALSSFSPNNTSFNSYFDYSIQNVNEFELIVKNPKGKTVFKTNNPKDKWTGINKKRQLEDPGHYSWKVTYKGPCTAGEYITKEGKVKLY